jgi:hypothetical protein
MPSFIRKLDELVDRQKVDLAKVAQMVAGFAGRHVEVDKYFAKFANSERTQVVFEKVS